ncbi:MAG: hypothetical protein H7Z42_03895 [Roseiflexaceae bacterium]|nr:hypothetical protein [Roseiflexaceae bacterium]
MPLTEITRSAIHVLCRELGVVNTARFLNQFNLGFGNYTVERDELFADMTVDDIVAEIHRMHRPNQVDE